MRNNDDPIQELNHFRRGIDNLADSKEINSDYSNDLHNCSNDLSGKGSIREEIAHAEFARRKREEMLENTDRYALKNANINRTTSKNGAKAILIFIIVFLWMVVNIVVEIFSMIGNMTIDMMKDNSSNYDVGNYEDYDNYSEIETIVLDEDSSYDSQLQTTNTTVQDIRNNILIESIITPDHNMILDISNNNSKTLKNVKIQVIFYDSEDKPIKICDGFVSSLFGNGRNIISIIDMPDIYERFEFLVTPLDMNDTIDIDISQMKLYVERNEEENFNVELTNNSEYKIDSVSVAIIYYKNNKIIDVDEDSMYDIKSGRTEREEIYNFHNSNDYDSIQCIISDIRIDD